MKEGVRDIKHSNINQNTFSGGHHTENMVEAIFGTKKKSRNLPELLKDHFLRARNSPLPSLTTWQKRSKTKRTGKIKICHSKM